MKSDEKIDPYIDLIQRHARVALKKVKKPAQYTLHDLTQEGAIVFLYTKKEYEDRGASFKTILTRRLRGHFTTLVMKSYRNKEINNIPNPETVPACRKSISDPFEIVQVSFIISDFTEDELAYINAIFSFAHISKRSRRKAAREIIMISYEREMKLRRSIKDKIRK